MKPLSKFLMRFMPAFICLIFLIIPLQPYAAMNDYCITPPFIVGGVTPNLLMMIDNSASMYDLTYVSPSGDYCYDTSYDDTNQYEGYFKQDEYYRYGGATGRFYPGAAMPVSCDYRTDYACINITGNTVDDFIAKGKFLNWLSSSKFDVQKKILTGGKYDTVNQVLIGESRGCVGRRFIKRIPAFSDITFAIRGPNALEPDYTNPETQGGLTRIEIFKGIYDNDACQTAIDTWQDYDPLGQWMNAAKECLGIAAGLGTASGRELATFIESVRGCWQIRKNIEGIEAGTLAFTAANLLSNVTITNLESHCSSVYMKDCPDPENLDTCVDILNNEEGGNYLCAKSVTHLAPPSPYYNFLGSDTSGFVGICWEGSPTFKFPNDHICTNREFLHYCSGFTGAEVVDPSGGASSDMSDNIPAVIRDASVRALGDPLTPAGSADDSFYAKASNLTAPDGIIQEFSGLIRFGALSFNYSGSPSECGIVNSNITCPKRCSITTSEICGVDTDCPLGETCVSISNLDGGQIIHHIGYVGNTLDDSVGDHSSGLINTLDNITADTWTPFAEGFYNAIGYFASRTDLRINPADFDETKIPVLYICQKNNILLVSDGMSTADLRNTVNTLVTTYNDGDGQIDTSVSATCPEYAGSRNLDDLAWLAKNRNIKDFTETPDAAYVNSQTITTYAVFNGLANDDPGECNPDTLLSETAENGCGTAPGCYERVEDPAALEQALREAFTMISGNAASGTAASVLASGEGSGANLVQAIFYPERTFSGTKINWIGSLKNLWYYIDPFLGSSSIREDTNQDKILNLQDDYVLHFYFDESSNLTKARRFDDSNGDGVVESVDEVTPEVYFESVKSLWEAGSKLWGMNPVDRTIYTYDGTSRILLPDTITTGATLISLLNATNADEATAIARYVKGTDLKICSTNKNICSTVADCTVAGETCDAYRSRTIKVDLNDDGDTLDTVDGISEGTAKVWKLGDIINSTPRIVSWVPLNLYNKSYNDKTYEEFIETTGYQSRGMVLVGANDGMLHAFNLGGLTLYEEKYKKAQLTGTATTLGREEWAFIPKNALSYLKYMADPSYCHLYYIDATPVMLDVSMNLTTGCVGDYWDCNKTVDSWRTIVIGGMRIGGACKSPADSDSNGVADACTKDINGDGIVDNRDCVLRPATDKGYSSYFALDITNPNDPQLLWEFSNENLGFSTTGPVVVRIAAKKTDGITPDNDKNGRWFVVFGSGPTGPIDTNTHQFKGYSDQNLRVFILDLKTGTLLRTIDSGIQNAFAGSMINSSIDFDQNDSTKSGFYQDDAIYFGFTKAENNPPVASTKWNVGGVLRLLTKNSLDPDDADATKKWALSKVIENIGPVTAAVARLQNYTDQKAWLFWGTGRYWFKIADNIDDADRIRSLYGVKEPCYSESGIDVDCTTTVSRSSLGDATSSSSSDSDGWYINLDSCTDLAGTTVLCTDASAAYKTERNVTDPLSTSIGAVFFTTTTPSADICAFGGVSHLWAVDYDTGGAVSSSILRGVALLQVSTGSIEEVDLKTAFTEKADESGRGRRTTAIQGVPPAGAPPGILIPPPPINKFIHLREK